MSSDDDPSPDDDRDSDADRVLEGTGVTPLAGVGTVVRYDPAAEIELPGPSDAPAGEPDEEWDRFIEARAATAEELQRERDRIEENVGAEEAEVLDAHLQFLEDPGIETSVRDRVDSGKPAERAVDEAFAEAIEQFESMGGRTGERADDLREVRDRLLRQLVGGARTDLSSLPPGTVLVTERLGPGDTAQLDPETIAGIATAKGGRTAHAAIVARSLGIPAVVGLGDRLGSIPEGATVLVDGEAGELVVDPSADRRQAAEDRDAVGVRHEPVATADGRSIEVAANVAAPEEAAAGRDRGADGIGLFRTEYLFVDRDEPPTEDEQYEAFLEVCETFPEDRVVVRTFDVGGDKPVPYLDVESEANPFLGVRGIRLALEERPDVFETQLRALLRVAASDAGEGLAVMFPMVATVEELDAALQLVESVREDLEADGIAARIPELGVMIETPASAFLAGALADRVDFLSVGTNDLTQYVMAADRGNEQVSTLHDPRQPAVLRALDRTAEAARESDAWIGMCGEMAGDPELTALLVGLGFEELSMSPVSIPRVKARIAETDAGRAEALAERALEAETLAEVETVLSEGP